MRGQAFANANPSALLCQMSAGSISGLVLGTTLLFCTAMNQLLMLVVAAKSMAAAHVNLSILDVAFNNEEWQATVALNKK